MTTTDAITVEYPTTNVNHLARFVTYDQDNTCSRANRCCRGISFGAAPQTPLCATRLYNSNRNAIVPAAAPIVAAVGKRPTKNIQTPINVIVTRKVYLRPMRSPIRPKISAPNGRTMKPTVNAANQVMISPNGVPVW